MRAHLKAMGIKTDISEIDGAMPAPAALFALMGQDKKVIAGQLNFIMAREIGQAFVTSDVSEAVVLSVLEASMDPRVV